MNGPEIKWKVVPVLVSAPIYYFAIRTKFINDLPLPSHFKYSLLYVVIVFILVSFSVGRENCLRIINGTEFKYVTDGPQNLAIGEIKKPTEYFRILAQVNDITFLFNPIDKSIVISKLAFGKSLTIKSFEEKKPPSGLEIILTSVKNNTNEIISYLKDKIIELFDPDAKGRAI
ncbi:hypothetical protein [Janthinobacterium sp. SUN206]|uniref:hypothetical protein n=1 Tax=Janthinobacterium sp. SUN206 TaxID=3014787 RepID=UPI0027143DF6|nr:hypothetical protein [Janthinobacterium sp. SUN206]MDO8065542.1 hypothetical protein [Janthinobacterium sp. SUN206]